MVNGIKVFTAAIFLLLSQLVMAAISSEIDRNRIEQGQSFRLILNISANEASQVDLEPLHKDFQILGRSHQSSTNFQNGSLTSSTKLVLTLFPKRPGKLTVPALELEGEKSQEHTVEVIEVKQPSAVDGGVEFLSSLSDKTPIVQQPIVYQASLVLGQKIYDAGIQEPQVREGKALIEPIGEQRQYQQELNGRPVLVIEQAWLITPQQSGTLKIDGARLSAQVPDRSQNADPYRRFNSRAMRRIFVPADDYEIEVQTIPQAFTGAHWLTATEMQLSDTFDQESGSWKQGEPATRTLTLEAIGVQKEQLPELVLPEVAGIKQYATKPQIEQRFVDGELQLIMTQEITLIPEVAGKVTLPAITLDWWNSKTSKQEMTSLAATEINIAQGAAMANPVAPQVTSPVPAPAPLHHKTTAQSVGSNQQTLIAPTVSHANTSSSWLMLGLGVFIGAFGAFLMMTLWQRKRLQPQAENPECSAKQPAYDLKKLKTLCFENNAREARAQLLSWAQQNYPGCRHLNDLAERVSAEFKYEIEFLNRSCFANETCTWDGKGLWKQVEVLEKNPVPQGSKGRQLAPLYIG
ncbi:BatD family protein [Neptuniibacter sp.]|uniref:BatD family protein n=1 Tax=Neptuniibacter sp. TaxID=1962643 RepID=UPI00262D1188|nr:BatD family protein [Neptuniibacter sp.]MCP4598044.1 protein BatD [Neptuniibacter sp.]